MLGGVDKIRGRAGELNIVAQSESWDRVAQPIQRQGGAELRFGSRCSSRHRFAPVATKPASSPQRTPVVKEGFPFRQKPRMANSS